MNLLEKLSTTVIGGLEEAFFRWGQFLSRNLYRVIMGSLLLCALSSLGLLRFRKESKANKLWTPPWSQFNVNEDWVNENFKKNDRGQTILYRADNVLTPRHIQQMYELHKRVSSIMVDGKSVDDICTKIPVASIFHANKRRRRRATLVSGPLGGGKVVNPDSVGDGSDDYEYEEYYDPWPQYDIKDRQYEAIDDAGTETPARISFDLYGPENGTRELTELPTDIKCGIVAGLREKCLQANLIEIWRYREDLIYSTTVEEILSAVNLLERSPWTAHKADFIDQLGGITRNSSGHVVAAESAILYWSLTVPEDAVLEVVGGGLGHALADATTLAWENRFIEVALNLSYPGVEIYPRAARSYGDISGDAIFTDARLLVGGYLIMFVYTLCMLGSRDKIEIRLYLGLTGIVSVGVGLWVGVGLSSALGFPYTPLHATLPLLCLGIGIDDMFVIVQCWYNMKQASSPDIRLSEAAGLTLKHAGVSVTITTLTDIMVFGVGAFTRMPGLKAFCVCAALSLAAIYLLQISLFTGVLLLDEKRIQAGRNGIFPCLVHQKEKNRSASKSFDFKSRFLSVYSKLLSSAVYKAVVLLTALGMAGVGAWGASLLLPKFDSVLYLPPQSYLRKWMLGKRELYPEEGWTTPVYTGPLDHTNLHQVDTLVNKIQALVEDKKYLRSQDPWWSKLNHFAVNNKNYSSWREFATKEAFPAILTDFLFTGVGAKYKNDFIFDGELECGHPAPPILASKFDVGFFEFSGPNEHIPAKRALDEAVAAANVSTVSFAHVYIFGAWETDEIIMTELYRNIGLAILSVAVVTLILIANIQICILVLASMSFTLVDILGFFHLWGMTVDVASCVSIVLAIGLCVDYSVHVAHAYLVAPGDRLAKALTGLQLIGPAVLNGGLTTFLAIVLLAASETQFFLVFFKVFFLTVVLGQFHGLVLLPVLLSIFGPLNTADDDPTSATADVTASATADVTTSAATADVTASATADVKSSYSRAAKQLASNTNLAFEPSN